MTVKQASARRGYLQQLEVEVPDTISTLQALINEVVRQKVNAFNASIEQQQLVGFLTVSERESEASTWKVGFDRVRGERQVRLEESYKQAESAFKDGLYRVFLNGEEITGYEQAIELNQRDEVVFLRLTMLAGRMW